MRRTLPAAFGAPAKAHAAVERTLSGTTDLAEVEIVGGWGSAACELNNQIAIEHQLWVAYLWSDHLGAEKVHLALPLSRARAADPRLGPISAR